MLNIFIEKRSRLQAVFEEILAPEIKQRVKEMELSSAVKLLTATTEINPNHYLQRYFDESLTKPHSEVLSINAVLDIGRAYFKGGREKTPVWAMLSEKYFVGRGYIAKLS